MKIGDIVEHINKQSKNGCPHNKKYVVYGKCCMKNPTTREWVDAIQYKETDNISGVIYVREVKDFESRFKLV